MVQVQYTTNKRTWLADINISLWLELLHNSDYFEYEIDRILIERYGEIEGWEILKWYN